MYKKNFIIFKKCCVVYISNVYMIKLFDKENVMELFVIRSIEKEKKRLNLNEIEIFKYVIKINRYFK